MRMPLVPLDSYWGVMYQALQATSTTSSGQAISPPSIAPDWLTAIGTLLAVAAALVIALGGIISRWWYGPKLSIEYQSEEPYARTANLAVKVERLGVARYAVV